MSDVNVIVSKRDWRQYVADHLAEILDLVKHKYPVKILASSVVLEVAGKQIVPVKFYGKEESMPQTMTDIQTCVVTLDEPVDAEGNPAGNFDAPPTWESSNPTNVTVQPAPDGMSCVVGTPSPGPLGSSTITAKGTVGGAQVVWSDSIEIVASQATDIKATWGTPS